GLGTGVGQGALFGAVLGAQQHAGEVREHISELRFDRNMDKVLSGFESPSASHTTADPAAGHAPGGVGLREPGDPGLGTSHDSGPGKSTAGDPPGGGVPDSGRQTQTSQPGGTSQSGGGGPKQQVRGPVGGGARGVDAGRPGPVA